MNPEEKEIDIILQLERKICILNTKLNRKNKKIDELNLIVLESKDHKSYIITKQKKTINNLSAELSKVNRKLKRYLRKK